MRLWGGEVWPGFAAPAEVFHGKTENWKPKTVFYVRLFGSVARGEATKTSDLDFLVTMAKGRSLLDPIGLWQDLEELFGCKVDVITDGGISPYLRDLTYAEAIPCGCAGDTLDHLS